jgi:hypothetical protein
MSTPRYIRKRNTVVVGYLYRITRIYVLASSLTLILGLIITQLLHLFASLGASLSPAAGAGELNRGTEHEHSYEGPVRRRNQPPHP